MTLNGTPPDPRKGGAQLPQAVLLALDAQAVRHQQEAHRLLKKLQHEVAALHALQTLVQHYADLLAGETAHDQPPDALLLQAIKEALHGNA